MLEKLLSFVIKASNLQPSYTPEHCLVVKRSVGGCTRCRDVCPHDAVRIRNRVEIDEIDCTGCGLCVRACPSQALTGPISYNPAAPIKCSQVKGSAQSVQCLAQLSPTDLVRLADREGNVTLARNDCASCKIGSGAVPGVLEHTIENAQALAEMGGRGLTAQTLVVETFEATDNPRKLSRRDLLRSGWRNMQHSAADVLAPLDPGDKSEHPLPGEMQKRYRLIEMAKPEPGDHVPWTLPRVAEGCITCPVCTNVCPTRAFSREFLPSGGSTILKLEPARCNGCNACVVSCPPHVISLDSQVTWEELSSGPLEVYRK